MTEVKPRPKATIEQKKWLSEFNAESNRQYNQKTIKENELKLLRSQCVEAIIGYGKALNKMTDELNVVEKQIKDLTSNPYRDSTTEFMRKFGKNQYELDFSN